MKKQTIFRDRKLHHKIYEKTSVLRAEFKKQTATAILAAFGFLIALSWQNVIKKIVDNMPKSGILIYHPYLADLYSAIVVTFIAVIGILLISKWAKPQ